MPQVSRAAVSRLASLALDVLDEAYKTAAEEPVERGTLHRLALGYLLLSGCATKGHASAIWRILGHENGFDCMSRRQSHYGCVTDGIRRNIGRLARHGEDRP